MAEVDQAKIAQFERSRIQLMNVSAQKQQMQVQSMAMKQALDELAKTKEKRVYKAVGNILIQEDVASVKKELQGKKESLDLRLKTVEKQEESLINKLNKLKSELEGGSRASKDKEDKK